jgi:hypothetical protein
MSKITLAPNAAGTGTLTVAAPNTSTDYTLTLPTATTTLVGTDATQTLTNKSIAGSQLTGTVASSLLSGALPAIDGSALTGIASMTLLGTITTTSGSTQTLSGLTLTSYKQVIAVIKGVSATSTFSLLSLGGFNIVDAQCAATNAFWGMITVDLATGVFQMMYYTFAVSENNGFARGPTTTPVGLTTGIQAALVNASTSITFTTSAGTFDAGSILIYGVK